MAVQRALGSRYLIGELISSGSMGTVWRGEDRQAGQPVAIKVLHERLAADPMVVTRFVRERTVLAGLEHPNLVTVHDLIMESNRLALVMDLVDGPDMHRYLRAYGPMAPVLAVTLIAQVCEALAVLHAAGIVHHDLKPANILLDASQPVPAARLSDFGIAWAAELPGITEGDVIGTPYYLAPETLDGKRGGAAADVYAAATSLFEALTGRPPFAGGPAAAVLWRHLNAEALRPPAVPDAL